MHTICALHFVHHLLYRKWGEKKKWNPHIMFVQILIAKQYIIHESYRRCIKVGDLVLIELGVSC